MKQNLFYKYKEVSSLLYYLELKKKQRMGFPITLGDVEKFPITKKVMKLVKR